MSRDEAVGGLWRGEMRKRARELARASEDAWGEVREARREKRPMPFISLSTGRDLSYVIEEARRWDALLAEMDERDVGTVSDLGPHRVAYWREALSDFGDQDRLSAAQEPTPDGRHVAPPAQRPFRRPPETGE